MKKLNKKGFTIVELVIVIAVIAILAAVLIPVFSNVIEKANNSNITQEVNSALKVILAEENGQLSYSSTYVFIYKDGNTTKYFKYDYDKKQIVGIVATNIPGYFDATKIFTADANDVVWTKDAAMVSEVKGAFREATPALTPTIIPDLNNVLVYKHVPNT